MFPNPQDALPLPPHPSLEQYKKRAKDLVKARKSGEPDAIKAWAKSWVETLVRLSGLTITAEMPVRVERWVDQVADFVRRRLAQGLGSPEDAKGGKFALAEAQFILARAHGFASWPKLAEHIAALASTTSHISNFEAAADAIVAGDTAALQRLLREDPKLIHARSAREHGATLLHYVSANGVEGYRQKTPKNVVEIAEILLKAGAEVDGTADVYGGGATTLGLAATSVHPERAGVQNELLQLLMDHGAAIDVPSMAGNSQSAVVGCLANGRRQAAEFLAEHGARLDLEGAAGLGRLGVVQSFVARDGSLRGDATRKQMESGFMWACEYGRDTVVEFLINTGVEVNLLVGGFTGLHWAAHGGNLETVKLLLKHGAPLEAKNEFGGTPLGQALWAAVNSGLDVDHVPVVECLIAAGAKVEPGWVTGIERIDEVLRRGKAKE